MDIQTYKEQSARTMSNQWHLTELDTKLLHCAIGMVTEFGELKQASMKLPLDTVNVMEECGDIFWYLAGFQRYYVDCDWEDVEPIQVTELRTLVDGGMDSAIEVLDAFKKWAYYGKPLSENHVKGHLYSVYKTCYTILKGIGYNIDDTRSINIQKLKDRFPEKFTTKDAINRDLDTERKTLEGQP
jgi:hypothetical protein